MRSTRCARRFCKGNRTLTGPTGHEKLAELHLLAFGQQWLLAGHCATGAGSMTLPSKALGGRLMHHLVISPPLGKNCTVHISGSPQFCRPHWIFSPAHPESGACWFEATRLSVDKRPLKTQGIGLWMMLGDVRIAVLFSLGPAWNSFIWWSITEILRNSLVRDGK